MLRVGFEPTPFRTKTLIWPLRPTRPSQLCDYKLIKGIISNRSALPAILSYTKKKKKKKKKPKMNVESGI